MTAAAWQTGSHFHIPPASLALGRVTLAGAEARHLLGPRRVRVGEPVLLADHEGRIGRACLLEGSGATAVLEVHEIVTVPRPQPAVTVVQAILPAEAGSQAVALMTEVGVDAVVPWQASRSVATWTRERQGRDRWQASAHEATKVSGRPYPPTIAEPVTLGALTSAIGRAAWALLLDPGAVRSLPAELAAGAAEPSDVTLVIGPEGGFTAEEAAALGDAGARPVRLGPTILRSRHAGAIAAALVLAKVRWQPPGVVGGGGDGRLGP